MRRACSATALGDRLLTYSQSQRSFVACAFPLRILLAGALEFYYNKYI